MSSSGNNLQDAWDQASRELNEIPLVLERVRYAAAIKPLLALPEDCRILEAGCGAGRILRTLHALGYHNVTGLEISQARLDLVRQLGGTSAQLVRSDGVPFDDASFDGVVSAAVIEHVEHPAQWLAELARVVKPGGILSITSDTYMWCWLKKLGLYKTIQPIDDAIWPTTLIDWARQAGLEVAGYGGFTNVPEQEWYLGKQLKRLLSPGRILYQLTGIRTRRKRTYAAYEYMDEVPGILQALDAFELTPDENFWAAVFSYESYFWFRKRDDAAAAAVSTERSYRAAA